MLAELMNSEKYWDNRFLTNWKEFSGEEQTKFFAQMMCKMFPQWFVRKIRENRLTICDMGCALGDATDVLTKYLNVDIDGADFSENAIREASKKYPNYNFFKVDLKDIPTDFQYDILIASNVLEHFEKPWSIVENMVAVAQKYIVLMMPYQEKLAIDEHVYQFDKHVIPLAVKDFILVFCDVLDGETIKNTLYPDQQILLIYSKDDNDKKSTYLSDICNVSSEKEKMLDVALQQEKEIKKSLKQDNESLKQKIQMLNEELVQVKSDLQQEYEIKTSLQQDNESLNQTIQILNAELVQVKSDLQQEYEFKSVLQSNNEKINQTIELLNSELSQHLANAILLEEQNHNLKQKLDEEILNKQQQETELQQKNKNISNTEK